MTPVISEYAFEEAIERALLRESAEGGYRKRRPEDYDRGLYLIPAVVVDFLLATQPKEWQKLRQHYGADVKPRFLGRLSREIGRRGALDVLRNGVKDSGCRFRLAYFRPASGLNEELRRLHAANLFAVVRQLRYSERGEQSLDLALFLNGIPIFTAELKNPLNGQDVEDAIRQYKTARDPREPLLAYGRCLAHFAVDPDLVFVTTRLAGPATRFLPFNQGRFGGAGNPPVPPTRRGFPTDYLWERIWTRDSVLDLVRQFIHEVEEEDDRGRKTGKRFLIFPRYQQLDCVRQLVSHARGPGPGQRYLIQHSAGSGKSFTIAWLAHQLSVLHDREDRRVFDSVVVVTDRRVLDRQLQSTIRQFEQTLGVVENIDRTSRQLREALEAGRTIIVTTLQKFPVIAEQIGQLPGQRFAVIVDEAHSSQSGESTKSLKAVLSAGSLAQAEKEEAGAETPEEEVEERVHEEIRKRGRLPNLSTFAFTATPKPKTLELFGRKRPDGSFEPFHRYSMRQAIEEGFILDVLASYATYKAYWRLLKKIEDDPRYDKGKAEYLLKSFVELHPHAIREKIAISVEHFAAQAAGGIDGRAKAMIVTRSRLHAVRSKLVLDRCLAEKGHPWKALVAFSGTVKDGGASYTESGMNSAGKQRVISERQTAAEFEKPEYRFLVVANKFQTGFDQPLLHMMYVDKKLGGVNAVQTLSRLNRTHPGKKGAMVLDFANEADEIKKAFEPYYETTLLSEETDPNLLYEVQDRLAGFGVFTAGDVEAFARVYFVPKVTQDRLYAALEPARRRFYELAPDEAGDFRGQLSDYVRLYAFLSQVLRFADRPRKALRLRPIPAASAAGRPRGAASRGPAEHRHGVVPHPADEPRRDRAGTAGPAARPRREQAPRRRRGGVGGALADHRGAERALRPEPRPRAPRHARAHPLGPRPGRRPRRQRPREHPRERAVDLRPQGRGQDPGDRRDQLRPLQAHHRRRWLRPGDQELPLRRLHAAAPASRGAAQAPGVEDARVQVEPALEPAGGPQGRQARDPRGAQVHRRVPQHRGRRPADRRGRPPQGARHRARPPE